MPSETEIRGATHAPRRRFFGPLHPYTRRRQCGRRQICRRNVCSNTPPVVCDAAHAGVLLPPWTNRNGPPGATATLAAARRRRSLPTQSPSRPVFPWEELRQSLRAFPGRGTKAVRPKAKKSRKGLTGRGDFFGRCAGDRGFIPAFRLRPFWWTLQAWVLSPLPPLAFRHPWSRPRMPKRRIPAGAQTIRPTAMSAAVRIASMFFR